MQLFHSISTEKLLGCLHDTSVEIIDIRPVDAYNGWKLSGEPRGGHIPRARSIPVKWCNYIDWIEIVRSKGITMDKSIVVYGYSHSDCRVVAERFSNANYENVFIYDQFLEVWSRQDKYPLERMKRYRQLLPPVWLKNELNSGFGENNIILCHAHYRNYSDYLDGHIPGAIALDTNWLESEQTWNRRSPEELEQIMSALGITKNSTVVCYGRFSFPDYSDPFPGSSAGHLGSIRCALILMYAGVKDVRILNGGLQSWLDEGYELAYDEVAPSPAANIGLNIPERPELIVDVTEAKEMLASDDAELVCVRSRPEYLGEVSGYNYIDKKGRIPGAVFGNCGSDAYHMENYRNLDHTTREYQEILNDWKEVGVVPEKHNAFYCGTGWRGSEAWLNAYLLGWPNVSVFDGGWFEWSNDPENPIESGTP